MGPTGENAVVQLHPTRRCNLRCLHCYSASSPEVRGALALEQALELVDWAADEGYRAISLSGGEPLLWEPLRALFVHARARGLATALTTNGMLLDRRRIAWLSGVTNLVAISLDGAPASHDRMRDRPGAFDAMRRRLGALRASGLRFGFLFTLTQHNLHELDQVARFALDEGASLLQIHPLEASGRAAETLADCAPDGIEATIAFIEGQRLQAELAGRLRVQVDLSVRPSLAAEPERVYAGPDPAANQPERPFAELLSPLVVEADGVLVPLQYGFDRSFAVGRLGAGSLALQARTWRRERLSAFRALCRGVHAAALAADEPPCFNWYAAVARAASGWTAPGTRLRASAC